MAIDTFINIIKCIITDKIQTIQYGYESRGGLEKWFQVEIYAICRARGYSIEREVPYDTKLCDFKIDDTFVELKVETAEYSGEALLEAYANDVTWMHDAGGYAVLITKNPYEFNPPEEHKIGEFSIIINY